MKVGSLKSALSFKASKGKICAIKGLATLEKPKTKTIATLLEFALSKDYRTVAFVLKNDMPVTVKSASNVKNVELRSVEALTTYDVLKNDSVVFSMEALEDITKRLTK